MKGQENIHIKKNAFLTPFLGQSRDIFFRKMQIFTKHHKKANSLKPAENLLIFTVNYCIVLITMLGALIRNEGVVGSSPITGTTK